MEKPAPSSVYVCSVLESSCGRFGDGPILRDHKIGIGLAVGSPNAPSQLVKLGQAKAVGVVDNDGVHRGDVKARLNNGCGEQKVVLIVVKGTHLLFQFLFGHLSVDNGHANGRNKPLDQVGDSAKAFDSVVDKKDLPSPFELTFNGIF